MLHNKHNEFNWWVDNYATPSATPGTAVTPGASNAEGSWTQIFSAANVAYDIDLLYIAIGGGNTTGTDKSHLVDIGVDPAGGTSYSAIINNIVCGQSQTVTTGWTDFIFPIRIKAGSTVAVRCQGVAATAGTIRVVCRGYGRPSRPAMLHSGQYSETIGTVTGSGGTSFTPGNAAEGSWVSLGTTTKDLWWWQLGVQCSNGTITAQYTHVDLAYGDATNKKMIIESLSIGWYGTAEIAAWTLPFYHIEGYCDVPAGSTIYVRGRCSTTPATGYNALAIGIGG